MKDDMMKYAPGLEGMVLGETAISNVEGDRGRLSYRGHAIEDLAAKNYLDVAHLVLFGDFPKDTVFAEFMSEHGTLSPGEIALIRRIPADLHPMKTLQAVIPLLTLKDARYEGVSAEAGEGLQLLAKYPSVIAAIKVARGGAADPHLFDRRGGYLQRFLTMFNCAPPGRRELDIFSITQILQMEHSFNAGTFATRVISSTLAPVSAVLSGGVGALSGILHGGADEAALRAAREIGGPEKAAEFVDELLAKKGRLMGMGHREYRTLDPRAKILKPLARELCEGSGLEKDFLTLLAIEEACNRRMAEKGKEVWANLEFYKGVVYEALGITPEYFTATFAMARTVGWLAHFIESRANNRIIRPAARYTGPALSAA